MFNIPDRHEDFQSQLEALRSGRCASVIVNYLNLDEAKALAKAIQENTALQSFDLSGPVGMGKGLPRVKALAEGLKGSSLLQLGVADALLGDEEVKVLAAVLKDTNIEGLQLGFNRFGLKGLRALAAGLKASKVTALELPRSGVGLAEVKALTEVLKLGRLRCLDLQNNCVGDAGAKVLAAVLKQSAIEDLNLSENDVGDEGGKALAAALPGSKVRILDLGSNHVGDVGVKALAKALKESRVEELFLFGNRLGEEGAQAIAAALAFSSLRLLDLSDYVGDPWSKETGEAFLEGLREAPLSDLFFGDADSNFGAKVKKEIQALLKANETRTFVLQMEVQHAEDKLSFKFRTLAGTVAALLDWSVDQAVQDLPEAVLKAVRGSGFKVPFKGLGASNLRIVKPDGSVLRVGHSAAQLSKQLALPKACKRPRQEAGSSKPPSKRSRK